MSMTSKDPINSPSPRYWMLWPGYVAVAITQPNADLIILQRDDNAVILVHGDPLVGTVILSVNQRARGEGL